MFWDRKRIVSTEKDENGEFILKLTRESYGFSEGDRYKITYIEGGLQLQVLPGQCDPIERYFIDQDCNRVFTILKNREPSCVKDMRALQYAMERSYLYTWMQRLIDRLGLELIDMQPLFALDSDELEEYEVVIKALKEWRHTGNPEDLGEKRDPEETSE